MDGSSRDVKQCVKDPVIIRCKVWVSTRSRMMVWMLKGLLTGVDIKTKSPEAPKQK